MILNTMAICLPRVATSNDAPRESTATRVNGVRRDSDRGSCCAISIGCTISMSIRCIYLRYGSIRTPAPGPPYDLSILGPESEWRVEPAINTQRSTLLPTAACELPYTLPQDFTLFVLLQEKTPEIWMRKLDWIAQHGGMALVDVHPDYLCFDNAIATSREYPVAHYKSFLEYVSRRYERRLLEHDTEKGGPVLRCVSRRLQQLAKARPIRHNFLWMSQFSEWDM